MSSSESVNKKFDENQNLVEDILEAAVASISNAHVQENPPVKNIDFFITLLYLVPKKIRIYLLQ